MTTLNPNVYISTIQIISIIKKFYNELKRTVHLGLDLAEVHILEASTLKNFEIKDRETVFF